MRLKMVLSRLAVLALLAMACVAQTKAEEVNTNAYKKHPKSYKEYHEKESYKPSKPDYKTPEGYEHPPAEYEHPRDGYKGYEGPPGGYEHPPGAYEPPEEYYGPYKSEPEVIELLPNELLPNGDFPEHLRLRLFGTPVGHVMNMSAPAGSKLDVDEDGFERHAPLMKMYDMWCDVPRDPPYGEAVPVGHVGHFHVTYKPAHHQKPWRLWGQTVLKIGKIQEFTLAHLDDDNDTSICATFFNSDTVITPLADTPIYNMLIHPKYPVNMQYVLDGMRAFPIPAKAASYDGKTDGDPKAGKSDPVKVVVEDGPVCRVAQVIWGRLSITTKVNGRTLAYIGTLYAVPDLDEAGMPMIMRRSGSNVEQTIELMCGDEVVKAAVPWHWEFDLQRVAPTPA